MSRSDAIPQKRGLLVQVKQGAQQSSQLSGRNGLYAPRPESHLLGGCTCQALGKNLLLLTPFTPSQSEERLKGDPLACNFALCGTLLDDFGLHSHGLNHMGASLSQPRMWWREGNDTEYRSLYGASLGVWPHSFHF